MKLKEKFEDIKNWYHGRQVIKALEDQFVRETNFRLLAQLKRDRLPVHVLTPAYPTPALSMVLGIDTAEGLLDLDELTPDIAHDTLMTNDVIEVYTNLEGIPLSFKTHIKNIEREGKLHYYQCALPEAINHPQHRQQYRVSIPEQFPMMLLLNNKYGKRTPCKVKDISSTGIKASIPLHIEQFLETEQDNRPAEIILPNDEHLDCRMDICHVDYAKTFNETVIGAKFKHISHAQEEKLHRFVLQIQRAKRRMAVGE